MALNNNKQTKMVHEVFLSTLVGTQGIYYMVHGGVTWYMGILDDASKLGLFECCFTSQKHLRSYQDGQK